MGIEALVLVVWPFGVGAGLWLIYRSFLPKSRPFALPTLIASLAAAFAFVVPLEPDPGFYWNSFIACFSASAIVFGMHAHFIWWLVNRRADQGRTALTNGSSESPIASSVSQGEDRCLR
jgi:hypothetical protein